MNKAKWFRIYSRIPIKSISGLLQSRPYSDKTGKGFELIHRDRDRIHCRFIERVTEREEITDPFGNTTPIEFVRYSSVSLQIHKAAIGSDGILLAEVISPPRSLRALVMELDNALDGVSVSEFEIDPFVLYLALRRQSKRAKVTRIKASRLRLATDSDMRVEVVSTGDAYRDFKNAFDKTEGMIDKIRVEHPFTDAAGQLEVSRNGMFAYDVAIEDSARFFLLEYLKTLPDGAPSLS